MQESLKQQRKNEQDNKRTHHKKNPTTKIRDIRTYESEQHTHSENNNKKNNHIDNLEWVTSSDNSLHSCYKTTGSKNGVSKLTEEEVKNIADLIKIGMKQTAIAQMYGVTPHCIFRIKAGDNWSWLTGFGKEETVHAPTY